MKLLILDSTRREHRDFQDLSEVLMAGDVLVMNDAGTLPASFQGVHERTGLMVEMRLASLLSPELSDPRRWSVFFLGEGTWRTPTENRKPAPTFQFGDRLRFEGGLFAQVIRVGKWVEIEFESAGESLLSQLYLAGRPIQYSHLKRDLHLYEVQTRFSGVPLALEAPSAAYPMTWELLLKLKAKGVEIATLTHAAGISNTGIVELDRDLPRPERYQIPERTARLVNHAVVEGRRVIALGTSVTRALEDSEAKAGSGVATLILSPDYRRKIVSGIITGFHEKGATHLKLLESFVSEKVLADAYGEAFKLGYRSHEFGDSCLIFGRSA